MLALKNCLVGAVFAAAALVSVPAFAADAVYSGQDGSPCADTRVLKKIVSRFDYQVKHVPELPDVAISDFHNIHQHRYIPSEELERPIARRYCGATAELSDGRRREVWYMIEEGMSFSTLIAGFGKADEVRGSNVEFCVSGFDRWFVYDSACRVLR